MHRISNLSEKDRYTQIADKLVHGGQAYRGVMEKLSEGASIYKDDGGAIRLFMGREGKIGFDDAVRGRIEWNRREIKDPVIVRSDGTALYNLATVVDDHDMQISRFSCRGTSVEYAHSVENIRGVGVGTAGVRAPAVRVRTRQQKETQQA
jgi:glutamyl/glutaminyl-tRNA synthetase